MSPEADRGGESGPSGRRFALLAVVGIALLAGGFALGRATDGDEPAEDAPVAANGDTDAQGADDAFGPIKSNADYDAEDVVAVFPPTIVTDSAIRNEKKGSPGRALLEWWQAYQFDDVVAVEGLTSPETIDAIGEDKLTELVLLPGPGLQGIEILDATESGNTASVNAGLLSFEPKEPGGPVPEKPSASVPTTFAMEKQGGEWLFAATEFLSLRLSSLPE